MPEYNVQQVLGKSLIARTEIPVWKEPRRPSKEIKGTIFKNVKINKGDYIGVVQGYVGGSGGEPLYWQFDTPSAQRGAVGASFWIEHKEGIFDIKNLKAQGALTVEEKTKKDEEENISTGDKIIDALKKGGKYILIAAALFYGVKLYKEFKK
jgi:hypothetical protein